MALSVFLVYKASCTDLYDSYFVLHEIELTMCRMVHNIMRHSISGATGIANKDNKGLARCLSYTCTVPQVSI